MNVMDHVIFALVLFIASGGMSFLMEYSKKLAISIALPLFLLGIWQLYLVFNP